MLKLISSAWNNVKAHLILYATFFGLLFGAFQSGVIVGEKSLDEIKESYSNKYNLIVQSAEHEKEKQEIRISSLESDINTLSKDKEYLRERLHEQEKKYKELVSDFKEISDKYVSSEQERKSAINESKRLEAVLDNNRPLLNWIRVPNDQSEKFAFSVVNESKIPLKIIETDYQSWSNGKPGNKNPGSESNILYPGKNNITFTFSHNKMNEVKEGLIDFRGGVCVKYTTLNKSDARYWIFKLSFFYSAKNNDYIVLKTTDTKVGEGTQCSVESSAYTD